MTVKEMIAELSKHPEDLQVGIYDMGYGGVNPRFEIFREKGDEDFNHKIMVAICTLPNKEE